MSPISYFDRDRRDLDPDEPAVPHCGAFWPNLGPAGGRWTCTLDQGHDGYHEARGPRGGRLFSSISQDSDEITWGTS